MEADGTNPVEISNGQASGAPSWSPTGRIAFVTNRDGNNEIYAVNSDGTGLMRLTTGLSLEFYPSWSSDGSRLTFVRDVDVYSIDADGGDLVRHTMNSGSHFDPRWSPDGTSLVFTRRDSDLLMDVVVAAADGSDEIVIGASPDTHERYPAWSPDGQEITFSSNRGQGTGYDVYAASADGGGTVARRTSTPENDRVPQWSPDGTQLVFEREVDTLSEVVLLPLGSGKDLNVSDDDADDTDPQWRPCP